MIVIPQLTNSIRAARIALVLCGCLGYGAALAQWHWIDAQGMKVFSDRPPGLDIPDKNILQRPKTPTPSDTPKATVSASAGGASASAGTAKSAVSAAAAASSAAKIKEQEANAKLVEQIKAIKVKNCAAANAKLNTLKSGVRISRINAKGEREFLDESGIAAEMKQTQRIADSECQ